MQEKGIQLYEDYSLFVGNLEEETNALLAEPVNEEITYSNMGILTIICC